MAKTEEEEGFNINEVFQYKVSNAERYSGIYFDPVVILGLAANILDAVGETDTAERIEDYVSKVKK